MTRTQEYRRFETKTSAKKVADAMAQIQGFNIFPEGNIFQIDQAIYAADLSMIGIPSETFYLRVHNRSGDKISVAITYPGGTRSTPHINDGADFDAMWDVRDFAGNGDHVVNRWRPGIAGFWGDGGGDIHFSIESHDGSAFLEITVTG